MSRKVNTKAGVVEFSVLESKGQFYVVEKTGNKVKKSLAKSKRNAYATMAKAAKALREKYAGLNTQPTRTNPMPDQKRNAADVRAARAAKVELAAKKAKAGRRAAKKANNQPATNNADLLAALATLGIKPSELLAVLTQLKNNK